MHIMANTRNQRQNYNQHHQYLHHQHPHHHHHHHHHNNNNNDHHQQQPNQHYNHNHNYHDEEQQQQQQRQKDLTLLSGTITPQHNAHYYYNSEAIGMGNIGAADRPYNSNSNNNNNCNSNTNGNSNSNIDCDGITAGADSHNDSRTPYQREVREWQHIDPDTGALLTGRLEADRWVNGHSHSYGKKSNTNGVEIGGGNCNSVLKSTMPIKNVMTSTLTSLNPSNTESNQKISLSSIVGNSNTATKSSNNRNSDTADMKSIKAIWQRQQQQPATEQPTLFRLSSSNSSSNNNNNSNTHKSHNKDNYPKSSSQSYSHSHLSSNQSHLLEKRCVGVNINCKHNHINDDDVNGNINNISKNDEEDDEFCTIKYTITKPTITLTANTTTAVAATTSTVTNVTVTSRDRQRNPYEYQMQSQQQQQQQPQSHPQPQQLEKSLSHHLEMDRLTTPPTRLQHSSIHQNRDLDNFRFGYNNSKRQTIADDDNNGDADDDNDDNKMHLKPSSSGNCDVRYSMDCNKRQQISGTSIELLKNPLQKSRSVSIDDLSSECNLYLEEGAEDNDEEQPTFWRRVSKLRRSFQSSHKSNEDYKSSSINRKPLDLPINSVSVAKIRAELESGLRTTTATVPASRIEMSDHVFNKHETKSTQSPINRKDSFLTAKSLKEIREKLKKVSDDSRRNEENLVNTCQHEVDKPIVNKLENVNERFRLFNSKKDENSTLITVSGKHASHSLESRLKYREPNSVEWHLRRKSYGFEKMSPPENKVMPGLDNSTDSGLGRSSELNTWSPTSETSSTKTTTISPNRNSTIIHFDNNYSRSNPSSTVQRLYTRISENNLEDSKRHSIALDERHYSTDNRLRQATQIRLNGTLYEPFLETNCSATTSAIPKSTSKRVEFCKTEVHFATESGRVNIVETDSKPPPTNNFRRRRRSSSMGPLQRLTHDIRSSSPIPSSLDYTRITTSPVTLFGETRHHTITPLTSKEAYVNDSSNNVTITVPCQNPSTSIDYVSSSNVSDNVDCGDMDDLTNLRGILKNKPAKPRPYVLGENIECAHDLWGNQQQQQLQQPIQQKQRITINKDTENCQPSTISANIIPRKIVAERIRLVEQNQQKHQHQHDEIINSPLEVHPSNTFSTKINVSLGDSAEHDLPKSNVMSIKLNSLSNAENTKDSVPNTIKPVKTTIIAQDTEEPCLTRNDSLKIIKEARGARQLREHELSYFGVPNNKATDKPVKDKIYSKSQTATNLSKRSLPTRRVKDEWLNDKPDLLKHQTTSILENPKSKERTSLLKHADSEEEHLYENIANEVTSVFKVTSPPASPLPPRPKSPSSSPPTTNYDRKLDVERDVRILSEMNRSADQTLKEIESKRNEKSALKNRLHNSLPRNKTKPLETIAEKAACTSRVVDANKVIKLIRGTYSSEAKRIPKHEPPMRSRERTSSQSSIDYCSRARSRSISSEKEYETVKIRNLRSINAKSMINRSNSCESQASSRTQNSSSEEPHLEALRRKERIRSKSKRHSNTPNASTSKSTSTQLRRNIPDDIKCSSTKYSSTNRERLECHKERSNYHQPTKATLQRISGSTHRSKNNSKDSSQQLRNSERSTRQRTHEKRNETPNKVQNFRSAEQRIKQDSQRLEEGNGNMEIEKATKIEHSNRCTTQQCHRDITKNQMLRHIKLNKKQTNDETSTTPSRNVTVQSYNNNQEMHQEQLNQLPQPSPLSFESKSKRNLNGNISTIVEHTHDLKTAFIRTAVKRNNKLSVRRQGKS